MQHEYRFQDELTCTTIPFHQKYHKSPENLTKLTKIMTYLDNSILQKHSHILNINQSSIEIQDCKVSKVERITSIPK